MSKRHRVLIGMFIVLVSSALISCGTIPEIRVTYRPPADTVDLGNKRFFLDFDDIRASKEIIGRNAMDQYKGFPGNFTMLLSDKVDHGVMIGIFDLKDLFLEAMKIRLKNHGIGFAEKEGMPGNRLIIALKEFSIDLIERKWVVRISYEVRIEIDGNERSRQTVNAQGERLKLFNHKQADILMSDIFTDSINRLDVISLVREGNL